MHIFGQCVGGYFFCAVESSYRQVYLPISGILASVPTPQMVYAHHLPLDEHRSEPQASRLVSVLVDGRIDGRDYGDVVR